MIKVELHCHTCYSKDSLVRLKELASACKKKGIQRLVVTDHNTIQGAQLAEKLNPQLFLVGEEIMTQQGELLGTFMREHVPPGLPARKTIELLRSQGAFISVSHPFDIYRKGHWEKSELLEITDSIDAIEVFNSRCINAQFNIQAKIYSIQHNLLATVGSDAHSLGEVGAATLTVPEFSDTAGLKQALSTAQADIRLSSPWVHLISRYAAWRKRVKPTIP